MERLLSRPFDNHSNVLRTAAAIILCLTIAVGNVQGQQTKFNWDQNYGTVKRLYPEPNRTYFRLIGGATGMNPTNGYYFLPRTHPNHDAMLRLLYLAAEKRWKLNVRTQPALEPSTGYAEVVYFVVDF